MATFLVPVQIRDIAEELITACGHHSLATFKKVDALRVSCIAAAQIRQAPPKQNQL